MPLCLDSASETTALRHSTKMFYYYYYYCVCKAHISLYLYRFVLSVIKRAITINVIVISARNVRFTLFKLCLL